MRRSKLMAAIPILIMVTSVVWAQWGTTPGAVTEQNEFGLVDYSKRVVQATGIGAVNPNAANTAVARAGAITAARADAYRRLIEAVKGVRVNSETTVRNSMVESDVINTSVTAMVRGARQVGDVKYLSDASVEVTMEVPISGVMDVVLPATVQETPVTVSITTPPASGETPAQPAQAVTPEVPGQPITGLIVDARGLGLKPSMSPRIVADDGSVLYGPGEYPRDFAVAQGVVGYHKDPEAAKGDARVAGNPVTIKGTGTSGTMGTDVVISRGDAQLAAGYDGFAAAIGNCRVMFILD